MGAEKCTRIGLLSRGPLEMRRRTGKDGKHFSYVVAFCFYRLPEIATLFKSSAGSIRFSVLYRTNVL